jgi:hypothetical protein
MEAVAIVFLYVRSKLATNPYIRAQVLALPFALSVCLVEVAETLLWSLDVASVTESSTHNCSSQNKALTLVIFLLVIPLQPFLIVYPLRRVGPNWQLLQISEIMAVLFFVLWNVGVLLGMVWKEAPLVSLQDSNYTSYLHLETCTFLGRHGHLHWGVAQLRHYMIPNAATYFLTAMTPVLFARPYRYLSGIFMILVLVCVIQFIYYEGSFEFGSVWCWSAFLLFFYLILQPYLLPIKPTRAQEDHTSPELQPETRTTITTKKPHVD